MYQMMPLGPDVVGAVPCPLCDDAPVKLPGVLADQVPGLCIRCFGRERALVEKHLGRQGHHVGAVVAASPCPVCHTEDVDADGATWWCTQCGISQRVAVRPT